MACLLVIQIDIKSVCYDRWHDLQQSKMKIDTLTPFQSTYGAHSKMSSLVLPFSMLKWPSLHTCYSRPIQLFKSLSSLLTKLRTMSEEKEVLLHAQASFRTGVGCTMYFRYFTIRCKSAPQDFCNLLCAH